MGECKDDAHWEKKRFGKQEGKHRIEGGNGIDYLDLEKEMATQIQCSCLENPRDGGAWRAAVYGVAQSWTQMKRLNSSSSRGIHMLNNLLLFI